MSPICSYTNDGNSFTSQCVANWVFTEDQLYYTVIVQGVITLISIVWEQAVIYEEKRIAYGQKEFSLTLRQWATTSRLAASFSRPIQMILSFLIFVAFSIRCNTFQVDSGAYNFLTFLYIFAICSYIVRFFSASNKLRYVLSPSSLIDILCITSHFVLGYGKTHILDGIPSRTWLDFSGFRTLFMYYSFVDMEKQFVKASRRIMLLRLWLKSLLLIMFAAGVIFTIETLGELPAFESTGFAHMYRCKNDTLSRFQNEDCDKEDWSIMFAFYFTVVTLATVGYGDNAPKTVLSRFLVILFIVAGIILFSMEIEHWITIYSLQRIGNPPFKKKPKTFHVVIMGNQSFAQLDALLRELFHEDHGTTQSEIRLHAVVLGDMNQKCSKELIRKLQSDPVLPTRVTFVGGSPFNVSDLDRADIKSSLAAFFFPDKLSPDPDSEDSYTIMRLLATKRHVGQHLRCMVMLMRTENQRHAIAAGVHEDDIVCDDVIKMGLLAQSCVCPGYSTLISNLSSSFALDQQLDFSTGMFSFISGKLNNMHLEKHLQMDDAIGKDPRKYWKEEYFQGAGKEVYVLFLGSSYANMTFTQATTKAFVESNGAVVILAIEIELDQQTSTTRSSLVSERNEMENARVFLNPGDNIKTVEQMKVYVIADDISSALLIGIGTTKEPGMSLEKVDSCLPSLSPASFSYFSNIDVPLSNSSSLRGSFVPYNSILDTPTTNGKLSNINLGSGVGSGVGDGVGTRTGAGVGAGAGGSTSSRKRAMVVSRTKRAVVSQMKHILDGSFRRHRHYDPRVALSSPFRRIAMRYGMKDSKFGGFKGKGGKLGLEVKPSIVKPLRTPSVQILQHPQHIVVCSHLGMKSLSTLRHFLAPLRGIYTTLEPPVTILDEAEYSESWGNALGSFNDVYHVRGSSLVHREMQRAGAKAASAVVILATQSKSPTSSWNNEIAKSMGSSIVDANAIFTTMLVEYKLQVPKIFTLTELADQSNSKLLPDVGSSAERNKKCVMEQLEQGRSLLNTILSTEQQTLERDTESIIRLTRYMSGRLLHPQMSENLVIQSFFNPNIHVIVRQLVGGPWSSGYIRLFSIPREFRNNEMTTYGDLFIHFTQSRVNGLLLGIYRAVPDPQSRPDLESHAPLPVVVTAPHCNSKIFPQDRVYVLVNWQSIEFAARDIQYAIRQWLKRRKICNKTY